ncbi:gamma-tubulin complex component 3 homolog [Planococcus citri]|uniref:gamma-tubulin complex component 3 homolog n=1 Tax=Planococcus citri TaxID=170843 RepID=UPI0031F9CFA5
MSHNLDKYNLLALKKLCCSLNGNSKDNLDHIFRKCLTTLTTYEDAEFQNSFSPFEEHQICSEIERVLSDMYPSSTEIVERFRALSRSLKKDTTSKLSSCYPQILLFLLRLNSPSPLSLSLLQLNENEINGNVSTPSTPDLINSTNFSSHCASSYSNHTTQNSFSVVSNHTEESVSLDRRLPNSEVYESPIVRKVNLNHLYSDTPILEPSATSSRKGSVPRTDGKMTKKRVDSSSDIEGSGDSMRPDHLSLHSRLVEPKKYDIMGDFEISEYEIIRELLFCMQGIEGKVIKYMSLEEGFHLNPCVKVNQPYMVMHIMELGYLHNKIQQSINTLFTDVGTVAQGLVNAVRREFTEYYHALAVLDSQLNPSPEIADTPLSEEECTKFKIPTLSQLVVWSRPQFLKLKTLCDVLKTVQDKRGGQIVSDLAFFAYDGNTESRKIIVRLLSSAIQPFYKQICYWVVNGEIIDSHDEFFIKTETNLDVVEKNSWEKQFILKPSMIPKYMSMEEAHQILEAGRCMNFLHNVCRERPPSTNAQLALLELEKNKWNDPLTLIAPGSQISELINKACREISKMVLNSLNENFKMQIHLEALRKYMLLGQGDFIHYLLKTIEPDLNKCVGTLQTINLIRSMDDAIYKSNAQFDDPQVLNKLCVKMMVTSERDSASEAFCLQYRLDGPLITIFKSSLVDYNRMFTFMWRVKRANYMVLKMWRGLKLLFKEVNYVIPEARAIFSKANCLVTEMVNFIGHFQYYIASEVVEVSWRKFQNEITSMESLDKVLKAHNEFLESMQSSCMLNAQPGSTQANMFWHIRTLLDYVQELVPVVEIFQTLCESEVERRRKRQQNMAEFGTSRQDEAENNTIIAQFHDELNKVKTKFKLLAKQHQDKLKSLLMLFSGNQQENSLILLSHRIDFNEYYKRNDSRLSDSLKLYK